MTLSVTGRSLYNLENLLFLGHPGVGKTHLAIALGVKACHQRHRVLFGTVADIVSRLRASRSDNSVERALKNFYIPSVLILDEIGYLPLNRGDSNLFFQLISKIYEHASIILTSIRALINGALSLMIVLLLRLSWTDYYIISPVSILEVKVTGLEKRKRNSLQNRNKYDIYYVH